MYHNFVLVQKIEENALVKVYFASKQYINWTYETRKKPTADLSNPMFPLIITDKDCEIQEKAKGNETQCFKVSKNTIRFIDDYGVPEGFLICVTGPSGYFPSMIKFGNKPNVLANGFKHSNPGIFDFYINSVTEQASVIVHTTERSLFSMVVDFEKYEHGFTFKRRTSFYDTFDFTLALNAEHFEEINRMQLKDVLIDINENQMDDIYNMLNEIVEMVKNDKNEKLDEKNAEKYSEIVTNLISTSSAAVTIMDSYMNHGSVGHILKTVIEYFK